MSNKKGINKKSNINKLTKKELVHYIRARVDSVNRKQRKLLTSKNADDNELGEYLGDTIERFTGYSKLNKQITRSNGKVDDTLYAKEELKNGALMHKLRFNSKENKDMSLNQMRSLAKAILEIDNQSNKKELKGNVKKKYENFKKGVYRIVGENDKINSILDDKRKIRKLFRRMSALMEEKGYSSEQALNVGSLEITSDDVNKIAKQIEKEDKIKRMWDDLTEGLNPIKVRNGKEYRR